MNIERRRLLTKAAAAMVEYVLEHEPDDFCGKLSLHFDLFKDGITSMSYDRRRTLPKGAIADGLRVR